MKHRLRITFSLSLLTLFVVIEGRPGVPLPSVTYTGSVRDAYGYPYTKDAEVTLSTGTVESVRYRITGERSPGVNYRLDLEMDSGGTPYEPYAVHVGDKLDIKVRYQGQNVAIMTNAMISSTSTLTVPAAGSTVRLDIQTGIDSDADGLPDLWEELLIAQSDGVLHTLADVRPGDDFDGDGSSNLHEFLSGTFPFLAHDCFAFDQLERVSDGRFSFQFLAVKGFTYQVHSSTNLTAGTWSDQFFATTPTAPVAPGFIYGDDTFKTVFVESTNSVGFFRLSIK
jgi:hypothetical protein